MPVRRNYGPCPRLPAAAISKPQTNAGTPIMATSVPARLRNELAFRSTRIHGAGRAATQVSARGAATTFDQARAEFEDAWAVFLSNRTNADFREWRRQRDFTERKYAVWKTSERFPSQRPNTIMRCPCGEAFDSHRLEHTLIHVPHISAVHRAQ
jgi:hypothetical protein